MQEKISLVILFALLVCAQPRCSLITLVWLLICDQYQYQTYFTEIAYSSVTWLWSLTYPQTLHSSVFSCAQSRCMWSCRWTTGFLTKDKM